MLVDANKLRGLRWDMSSTFLVTVMKGFKGARICCGPWFREMQSILEGMARQYGRLRSVEAGTCGLLHRSGGREIGLELCSPLSDPLPPIRTHLLKVLQTSQIVTPTGNQVFKHINLWGHFTWKREQEMTLCYRGESCI